MKGFVHRLATAALLAAVLATAICAPLATQAAGSAQPSMRLAMLASSGPHTVRAGTLVTFHLRERGMSFGPKHIGDPAIPGHGHIQLYLDRIQADATRRAYLKGIAAVAASPSFSLGFTQRWLQRHAKHHRVLLAVARNDGVLDPVPPVVFRLTVR